MLPRLVHLPLPGPECVSLDLSPGPALVCASGTSVEPSQLGGETFTAGSSEQTQHRHVDQQPLKARSHRRCTKHRGATT